MFDLIREVFAIINQVDVAMFIGNKDDIHEAAVLCSRAYIRLLGEQNATGYDFRPGKYSGSVLKRRARDMYMDMLPAASEAAWNSIGVGLNNHNIDMWKKSIQDWEQWKEELAA